MFGVFLVRIFPHSAGIRRFTEYILLFNLNAGKNVPEKLRIRTLFTQRLRNLETRQQTVIETSFFYFCEYRGNLDEKFDCVKVFI